MSFKVYKDLAWVEAIIAPPETSYKEEVTTYINLIKKKSKGDLKTVLHLGCGAGGHDFHLKKYFDITGVDLSKEMLAEAKKNNPEIKYIEGDMRTINLSKKFDIVMIPDSIMYMNTIKDLKKVIETSKKHLNPNGMLFIVIHTKEDFKENNFSYTGKNNSTHVTIFENNYITSKSTYQSTMVYLIRENSDLKIYYDVHTLGLFEEKIWVDILTEASYEIDIFNITDLYDKFLLENGEYNLKILICTLK